MLKDSTATRSHPGRPSAHLPGSFSHGNPSPASSTCSLRAQAARDEETRRSGLACRLSPICQTSEESNGTGDSHKLPAEIWFDLSNKNVGGRLGPQFLDNDPPFFLQNQALSYPSYGIDTDGLGNAPRPSDHNTSGSSADDFRSVIDDLTIQNKKLKEKLRRYERSYGTRAHLEKDRLFEVKFHGLSPGKKRELEEKLHAFASGIGKDESLITSNSEFPSKEDSHEGTSLRHSSKIPSSTSTNSRLVDSAYASMSTSGPISSSAANHVGHDKKDGSLPSASKLGKVQSFLDDFPRGLLPKNPTVMTERGKKKLVVRRLEQLFTGKLRVLRSFNSQSQQQQEVSDSAARDDRQAIERQGQQVSAEGIREAYILDTEMELERAKLPKLHAESSVNSSTASQAEAGDRSTDSLSSPGQRPTRPLDLDPDRAQVPSENMEYIRHLGTSTPVMASEDATEFFWDDNHDWVYLNLLINMAQLHIINVTPHFIRSAVTELSTKFQLSPDGRKIRWRGGTEGTELSSDSGADNGLRSSPDGSDSRDEGSQQKGKVETAAEQISSVEPAIKKGRFSLIPVAGLGRSQPTQVRARQHELHYTPLFAHELGSEDDGTSLDMNDSTSQGSYAPADDSGPCLTSNNARATGRRSRSRLSSKRKRDDGGVVFYSGAPFCTDLSGDRENIITPLHVSAVDIDGFSNHSHDALGCRPKKFLRPGPSQTSTESLPPFRPFKDSSVSAGPISGRETRSITPELTKFDEDSYPDFSPQWTLSDEQRNSDPIRLEACGLGGTQPADHFAYTVKTKRRKLDGRMRLKLSKYSPAGPRLQRFLHPISNSSLDTFLSPYQGENKAPQRNSTSNALPLQAEILSTQYQALEPSELPPPASYHGPFSNSTEWSDDSFSDDSDQGMAMGRQRPQFPVRSLLSNSSHDPMDMDDLISHHETSDMDESDTSSIDILAHARKVDPDAVAAKEQEYERETSRRIDEKFPATADSVYGTQNSLDMIYEYTA